MADTNTTKEIFRRTEFETTTLIKPSTLTLPEPLRKKITASPTDNSTYQRDIALILRNLAVEHLRTGSGIVAQSFRGEYSAVSDSSTYETYLANQSRPGTWGTYIEAAALGESLGVNVVTTCHNNRGQEKTFVLYRAENDNAPTIHLHNTNNTHWYFPQSQNITGGDGNCLYNAVAQGLHHIFKTTASALTAATKPERAQTPTPTVITQQNTVPFVRPSILANTSEINLSKAEQDAIKNQHRIAELLNKAPRPSEIEQSLVAEKARIAKLPLAEQQQIASDYKLALKLAAEDFQGPESCQILPTTAQRGVTDNTNKKNTAPDHSAPTSPACAA